MEADPTTPPARTTHDKGPDDDLRRLLLGLLPGFLFSADALAQDASKIQPGAYKVAFENDKVRVLDFRSRPGLGVCGVGVHSHPAHLTIALSPARVRVSMSDGKSFMAENQTGDVFWSEAETHETENISGREVRALLVELKAPPGRSG